MKLEELKKFVDEACGDYNPQQPQQGNFSGEKKASGGKMARTDLVTIARDAQELLNMFGDDAELPDWVESKLTKASDYLNTVRKYIGGEIVRQQGSLMENINRQQTENKAMLIASAATSAMRRLEDPEGIYPTLLMHFFQDKEDMLGFLDGFHLEIRRELMREIDYEERFAKKNPAMADKLKKGEEQPSLGLQEDREVYLYIEDATYDDGSIVEEDFEFWSDVLEEAEYRGRKVKLNKPMRGDVKKFKVFVKDPKTGNVKKVNYGDPNMRIKKSSPARRKSFRARHNCDNPGPKTKARYWSCRKW
jgi:hypothetical protein